MKLLLALFLSLPLQAESILTQTFITPANFKPANHGASLAAFPDNTILACWYAGDHEGARDVQIFCSRSEDKGSNWSYPVSVVGVGESPTRSWFKSKTVGNVALYLDDDNTLWMFYSSVVFGGWSGSHVDYKTSRDFGRTWSNGTRYIGTFGNLPRNKPIKISQNKFFLPLYHELTSFQGYGCMIETANGKIRKSRCYDIPGSKHGQPSFVKMDDTRVFAYLRTKGVGKTMWSRFDLNRNVWSEPQKLEIPNSDSAVDALKIPDGVLMVMNNSATSRIPLSLMYARDGFHFQSLFDFEPQIDASYPAFIQNGDEYLVAYTFNGRGGIKFARFNQQWLNEKLH